MDEARVRLKVVRRQAFLLLESYKLYGLDDMLGTRGL